MTMEKLTRDRCAVKALSDFDRQMEAAFRLAFEAPIGSQEESRGLARLRQLLAIADMQVDA